jgi:hypothetical protein
MEVAMRTVGFACMHVMITAATKGNHLPGFLHIGKDGKHEHLVERNRPQP